MQAACRCTQTVLDPAGGGKPSYINTGSASLRNTCSMLLQALGGEAMQLLWALADHSPEALTALEAHNLELGQPACLAGSPWESMLVRQCLLMYLADKLSISNCARLRDASRTALQDP